MITYHEVYPSKTRWSPKGQLVPIPSTTANYSVEGPVSCPAPPILCVCSNVVSSPKKITSKSTFLTSTFPVLPQYKHLSVNIYTRFCYKLCHKLWSMAFYHKLNHSSPFYSSPLDSIFVTNLGPPSKFTSEPNCKIVERNLAQSKQHHPMNPIYKNECTTSTTPHLSPKARGLGPCPSNTILRTHFCDHSIRIILIYQNSYFFILFIVSFCYSNFFTLYFPLEFTSDHNPDHNPAENVTATPHFTLERTLTSPKVSW